MKNLLRKAREDTRGETAIELVTTIFVMTIVLPAILVLFTTTLSSREVSHSLMSNAINTDSVQNSLNNDIQTSTAMNIVSDGSVLKLRSNDGTCKEWRLQDTNLVRATSDTAITNDSGWITVGENFAPINSEAIFAKTSTGTIGYNFNVGKASIISEFRGSATQTSASSGAGECW
jgi:hypothetical protein